MSLRRKVFVLNGTEATHANVVSASATNPLEAIVDGSPRELICAWLAKGFTYKAIDAVAETAQIVSIAIGTVVSGQKYTVERQPNPMALLSRDANFPANTKKYILTAGSATKKTLIDDFIALINADANNFAVASSTGPDTSLVITEDGGYGLNKDNPGPAFWRMYSTAATVLTYSVTPAVVPVGLGTVMLYNKAVWTPDGKWIMSGEERYNFDKTLPVAGSSYTTLIISAKYPLQDHDQTVPDLIDEIVLYVDNAAGNDDALKTQLSTDVTANA